MVLCIIFFFFFFKYIPWFTILSTCYRSYFVLFFVDYKMLHAFTDLECRQVNDGMEVVTWMEAHLNVSLHWIVRNT